MTKETERAVITVIGKDQVGILAKVATSCASAKANIVDVTQSVLEEFFCMVMIVDIADATQDLEGLQQAILHEIPDMQVRVMHENIFNSMHQI